MRFSNDYKSNLHTHIQFSYNPSVKFSLNLMKSDINSYFTIDRLYRNYKHRKRRQRRSVIIKSSSVRLYFRLFLFMFSKNGITKEISFTIKKKERRKKQEKKSIFPIQKEDLTFYHKVHTFSQSDSNFFFFFLLLYIKQ